MPDADGLIAVDWGTTNRRAYLLDGSGRETKRIHDGKGTLAVTPGAFPTAAAELRDTLGQLPLLLAGMAGSNRGWLEAPYVPCPVTFDRIVERLVEVPGERAWIVPGVCDRADGRYDVMRGEEVQLLGVLASGRVPPDGVACHPGTHAKWARFERGAIASFRTVMTGELFALLKTHSILAPQLGAPVEISPAFFEGVDRSLHGAELAADLFSVRARGLLAGLNEADASAFTSGLLIGADVRIGAPADAGTPVTLIGEPNLTRLYAAALERAERSCTLVDGDTAFLDGIRAIREKMR